eukprot:2276682-Amphidinium_carterae.1
MSALAQSSDHINEANTEQCYVSKDELEQLLGMEGMVEWLEDISLSEVEVDPLGSCSELHLLQNAQRSEDDGCNVGVF